MIRTVLRVLACVIAVAAVIDPAFRTSRAGSAGRRRAHGRRGAGGRPAVRFARSWNRRCRRAGGQHRIRRARADRRRRGDRRRGDLRMACRSRSSHRRPVRPVGSGALDGRASPGPARLVRDGDRRGRRSQHAARLVVRDRARASRGRGRSDRSPLVDGDRAGDRAAVVRAADGRQLRGDACDVLPVDGTADGAAAGPPVQVLAEQRRLRIVAFDPRPSWGSGFIRRALEADPIFEVADPGPRFAGPRGSHRRRADRAQRRFAESVRPRAGRCAGGTDGGGVERPRAVRHRARRHGRIRRRSKVVRRVPAAARDCQASRRRCSRSRSR